ncbi:hypothetical protein MtrunA17_Chr3g0134361 [Medicago truncatula]|uniref:Transmembrane protein n=1 Tax=Medicago truncatula TaxID=3880 RepID=A0A396J0B0_MEDTR|nr:hypothetical protein MtrunA17_Chr3g0134361 [Medicago truncatula]
MKCILFTQQHVLILVLMILFCLSSWCVEGSRHSPATSFSFNHFIMAQAYSGPSRRGRGHSLIS